MHLKFSIALGTPVVEDESHQMIGKVSGVLLHPDTGQIVGFFVLVSSGLLSTHELFVQCPDIISWGTRVHVRSADRLVPPEDVVRVTNIMSGGRTILGQNVVTERKKTLLGVCRDIQFSTRTFMLEYLFPQKMFFAGTPIPASDVVRVTETAIIVREPARRKKVKSAIPEAEQLLPTVTEVLPAVSMKTDPD